MTRIDQSVNAVSIDVARNRGWFFALGILLMLLGAAAIAAPLASTIAVKIVIGWVFLLGGVGHVIHAFSTRSWKGFVADLLIGVLYAAVGVWLAFFPLTGIIALTALLAIVFVADGAGKLAIAAAVRPVDGWLWIAISGVVAIIAGVLLFLGLPSTATWAIGLLTGVNILVSGFAFLMVALAA